MVPFNESIASSFGTAVISFELGISVAICPSTSLASLPQALTMCSADFPLALSKERRSTLPSTATTPWQASGKPAHEALEACQSRNCSGIEPAKQTAEDVSC